VAVDRPPSLVGLPIGGAYICEQWELRVTARCLEEDLNAASDATFEAVSGLEIVKAFIGERATHVESTRQVTPLTCSRPVWALGRGHDHRGATLYDRGRAVMWLVAYGRHRSGEDGDFFPYCKALDAAKRLLPTKDDYRRMLLERDQRFVEAVRVEAPLILRKAREADGEYQCTIGGALGAGCSIEVDEDLDVTAVTVALDGNAVESYEQIIVVLASLVPGQWEPIDRMPSRELDPAEVAYTIMLTSGEAT
jgi:hypothetical protein